jgi:transposase
MSASCELSHVLYCETLKNHRTIQNKGRGMLTSGIVLLHENASPHIAVRTRQLPEHFNWELFEHPPCSPDLAPSDYHLFTYLKNWLESQRFNNNERLMDGVKLWLSSQAADLFDTDIQTLIPRFDSVSISAVTTLRCSLSM